MSDHRVRSHAMLYASKFYFVFLRQISTSNSFFTISFLVGKDSYSRTRTCRRSRFQCWCLLNFSAIVEMPLMVCCLDLQGGTNCLSRITFSVTNKLSNVHVRCVVLINEILTKTDPFLHVRFAVKMKSCT